MTVLRPFEAIQPTTEHDSKSAVFAAISDPTRRAIIERLAAHGPMTVGELSVPFDVSAPAISRHLKVLEMARIVSRTVDKQWRVCTLQVEDMQQARRWLDSVLPAND